MTFLQFHQTVAAVFLGAIMAAFFLKAVFGGERLEREGVPQNRLPWWVYVGGALPPLYVAWITYTLPI